MKKIISIALVVGLILSLVTISPFAATASGTVLGKDCTVGGRSIISGDNAILNCTKNTDTIPSTLTFNVTVEEDGYYTLYWTKKQPNTYSGGAQIINVSVNGNLVAKFGDNDSASGGEADADFVKEPLVHKLALRAGTNYTIEVKNTQWLNYGCTVQSFSWEKEVNDGIFHAKYATPSGRSTTDANYGNLGHKKDTDTVPSALEFEMYIDTPGLYNLSWTKKQAAAASGGAQYNTVYVDGNQVARSEQRRVGYEC
jgi:hypothetical protein